MKTFITLLFLLTLILAGFCFRQENYPWTKKQLMEPSELVSLMKEKDKPLVYNMGPVGSIKGAIEIGPAQEKENFEKFKKSLENISKDRKIVIYCGCCPFEHCPNIRPPFGFLIEHGYKNSFVLNLPHNLKTDWIDKGFSIKP